MIINIFKLLFKDVGDKMLEMQAEHLEIEAVQANV